MAKRYGGKYSPGEVDLQADAPDISRFRGRRAANVNVFARLMYFAPLPLLTSGLGEVSRGDALGMVAELGALVLLLSGAWLLNEGLKAENAYRARKIARPPAIPRKFLSLVATAAGVGLAAWLGAGYGLIPGIVFGAVAGAAHLFAFGLDPMKKKGMEGMSDFETNRVAEAIDSAEGVAAEILSVARRIGDRAIEGRVEQMLTTVREVFRTVEDDPRDLPRARKFLGVYLRGARDATIKYADLAGRSRDSEARDKYMALLDDMDRSFRNHRQELLEDNRSALDIEIEVLRERLQREGV